MIRQSIPSCRSSPSFPVAEPFVACSLVLFSLITFLVVWFSLYCLTVGYSLVSQCVKMTLSLNYKYKNQLSVLVTQPNIILQNYFTNARVKDLFDPDTHGWNSPLLESIFQPDEVKAIKTIPLSRTNQEDKQIWRGTTNGIFSVRSAYHLAKEEEDSKQPECSHRREDSELWGTLWELDTPNADKNFMWRACNGILPTKVNLYRRKIVQDDRCPICNLEGESVCRILWTCPSAMDMGSKHSAIPEMLYPRKLF
jgi:hypothetical protein